MTSEPAFLEFTPGRPDEVVVTMEALSAAGKGWINFQPAVYVEDVPPDSGMFSLFSSRGPAVPLATWTPASAPRRGRPDRVMIGLQHPAGAKVKPRLGDIGQPLPQGWVVVQDYVKKGLVVTVPPTATHAEVLAWLIGTATALSSVPLTGKWRAAVYSG